MRGSILGSGLVHLALLVVLLAVRASHPIVVPGPDVIQVALTDVPLPTVAAPPPPPERETEPAEIAPTEDEGVKIEKQPKKKPEPEKKPEERVPEPPSTPAPALPYARVGNAGLRGQVAIDAADFEFTYYLTLVRNRIAQNWTPPAGLTGGRPRSVVYFKIRRNGDVVGIALETSSGAEHFDRSALRAVTISNPLPPLPLGWSGGDLGVHFGFEYENP
jgi:protein TonB